MIVPSMTDLELLNEIEKDYEDIQQLIKGIDNSPVYKKHLQWGKPQNGYFMFMKEDWKSKRGNKYTLIFYTTGWQEVKKHGFYVCVFTFIQRNNALNAVRNIVMNGADIGIEILTSHFIDRYNQRFLKKPFLSRKEIVIEFFKRNKRSTYHNLDSSKYDCSIMNVVQDGFIFGKQEHERVIVNKTFVSRDMLFGEQYDEADLLDETLAKLEKGGDSNIFKADVLLEEAISRESVIPTIEDYSKAKEMYAQLCEKKKAIETEGKISDLQYVEMMNNLVIWLAGFDWLKAQLKDDNGQLLDLKFILEVLYGNKHKDSSQL